MSFQCGIVGLPNVGKSTLFNALTKTAAAEAANYPFCTIEPNVGRVSVPDERLSKLSEIASSEKTLPTFIEFVDIAGLVEGASKGEGLGNQFLAHIREVDAIIYVLRCFDDENITHVVGSIDPLRDVEIVEMELIIADLESVTKRLVGVEKKAKSGDKEAKKLAPLLQKIQALLESEKPARDGDYTEDERVMLKQLQLLTTKPVMYVANVPEENAKDGNAYSSHVENYAQTQGHHSVIISAQIEAEISQLDSDEEKAAFLEEMGLSETGLSRVIKAGYQLLDLNTFYTAGPKEARAWTVKKGALAPEAAGVIHTDFQKGFIRAETIGYSDYLACSGEVGAKEAGKMRLEGKDYVVQDGDVMHFRFNV